MIVKARVTLLVAVDVDTNNHEAAKKAANDYCQALELNELCFIPEIYGAECETESVEIVGWRT